VLAASAVGVVACGDDSDGVALGALDDAARDTSPDPSRGDEPGGGADARDASRPMAGDATSDSSWPWEPATPPQPDASLDAGPSLPSPSFVYRDLNHVLGTGEGLALGVFGTPPITTVQPYSNLTFATGAMSGDTNLTSFIPLVEGDVVPGTIVPVETMSTSFANAITRVARTQFVVGLPPGKTSHDLLVSVHGARGAPYAALKKGTAPYAAGLAQAQAGRDLAVAAGQSYVVRAVTNVHGESDSEAGNTAYAANLLEWQTDYETDIRAITGQSDPIPMFVSQPSSWTRGSGLPTTSLIPGAMLDAHVAAPGKVVLVGPKYHLPYAADGVHLSAVGYQQLGEEYAKVYRRVILEGKPWEPVRPMAVTRVDAEIFLDMYVPSPPLTFEDLRVTDPGHAGFEWVDDGPDTPSIVAVIILNGKTVAIQLSHAPTGGHHRLRYAFTGVPGVPAGPRTGPRGIIRDSDPTMSVAGVPLYNYCVHFDIEAP
jgi:hypothetical protein